MNPPPQLELPARQRLDDQIVDLLTEAIVDGRYPPDSSLPPERNLAEQLGVNRTSLRQALSRLEQLGLVETQHGRGTVVLDPTQNPDPAVLAKVLDHVGDDFLAELFEVRDGVCELVAQLAATRATRDDVDRLRAATDVVRHAATDADRQLAELAWFGVLVEVTRNRALMLLVRWVWRAYGDTGTSFESAFRDAAAITAGLDTVVDAVARHRPSAAQRAMASYSRTSGERMRAALRGANPATLTEP
jgi:GntR family transcriptional regulator, transcriptional repressor for pyruvate dehydrogenase complex